MQNFFYFSDINYCSLPENQAEQLFSLRKKTFYERLCWDVECTGDKEFDEYDNPNATYLLGFYRDEIICGTRMIDMRNPNMITGVFYKYFSEISLPEKNCLEASRFFVDKPGVSARGLQASPVSHMLFLSMINYSMQLNYCGVYAIVSRQMYAILVRSGWGPEVMKEGLSEKHEKIYLVFLPTDRVSRKNFIDKLSVIHAIKGQMLYEWPLNFTMK